jgi:hypothetical protein
VYLPALSPPYEKRGVAKENKCYVTKIHCLVSLSCLYVIGPVCLTQKNNTFAEEKSKRATHPQKGRFVLYSAFKCPFAEKINPHIISY